MTHDFSGFLPALPIVKIGNDGGAFIAGSRCVHCGQTYSGERLACAQCGRRDAIESVRLGGRGKLYNFTVVYRSYPGVVTPFVAAVVDLDDGGSLRGTLVDVDPNPMTLERDMIVDVVFRDTGQTSTDGKRFVSYYFVPAQEAAA